MFLSCHIRLESESTLSNCLSVKQLPTRIKQEMAKWLSDHLLIKWL